MTIRNTLLEDAKKCARLAGEVALGYFRCSSEIENQNKLNDSDIVTVADKASEAIIKKFITEHYPSHSILSEETEGIEGEGEWQWIIDPIDGTSNFFSGLPIWAISIGIQLNGITEVGVVYLPFTDEMFCATRGGGAMLNNSPIHVNKECSLGRVLVSTGFPVDKSTNTDNNLVEVSRILPLVRDLRRLGAASADICYVAAGYLGGYWEMNLHIWDICAASLILQEAGGVISDYRSDRNLSIVCGNKTIHDRLFKLLTQ